MSRIGILLAGGTGSRLWPITLGVSKQVLAVYDKPQFYYALSTLMLADIREICIVTNPENTEVYASYFGDGSEIGMTLHYVSQKEPRGIADAFNVCKQYIQNKKCAFILGDNIFIGNELTRDITNPSLNDYGATLFVQEVSNPSAYGVIEYKENGEIGKIIEKPLNAASNHAVTGLYFYDENVSYFAAQLTPSSRGELEITDLNNIYLKNGELNAQKFGRGHIWFDTGNPRDLLDAGNLVEILQRRTNLMIGCPEEIAFQKNWITGDALIALSRKNAKTNYGIYLKGLATCSA